MSTKEQGTRSFRAPMAWKFFLLMALIVPSTLAVSWVGGRGMQQMKARLDVLYEDNLTSIQAISRLSLTLEEAEEMSLRLIGDVDPVSLESVRTELRRGGVPRRGAGDRLPAIDLGVVRRTGPASTTCTRHGRSSGHSRTHPSSWPPRVDVSRTIGSSSPRPRR